MRFRIRAFRYGLDGLVVANLAVMGASVSTNPFNIVWQLLWVFYGLTAGAAVGLVTVVLVVLPVLTARTAAKVRAADSDKPRCKVLSYRSTHAPSGAMHVGACAAAEAAVVGSTFGVQHSAEPLLSYAMFVSWSLCAEVTRARYSRGKILCLRQPKNQCKDSKLMHGSGGCRPITRSSGRTSRRATARAWSCPCWSRSAGWTPGSARTQTARRGSPSPGDRGGP